MKKLLFIAIMMMAALSVNAQGEEILTTQQSDIKGSWHAIVDDIYTCFTFANNGLVNVLMTVDINDENFSAQMKVTIPGTYSVTGSKLNIVTDKERCDIQLDNFKMKGDAEGMEDIAKNLLVEYFSEHKEEVTSEFNFGEITIVSVTVDTLELDFGDRVISFEKVK
jgi:hypothetical protein